MWVIEKRKRNDEAVHWESVLEYPTFEYEDIGAVGMAFVAEFNCDMLDKDYYYRIVWN